MQTKVTDGSSIVFTDDGTTGLGGSSAGSISIGTAGSLTAGSTSSHTVTTAGTSYPYSGGIGQSSSGNIWITPGGSSGISISGQEKHVVFRLPESSLPNKVYVSGRMVTVGMLGSDVQAAYCGGNKLVFSPGELTVIKFNDRLTVSLDYGDFVHHYNVETDYNGAVQYEEDSTVIQTKLVSKVAQR